jgi:hypothetical protein
MSPEMKAHRKQNFDLRVVKHETDADRVTINYTINGYQHHSFDLTREELGILVMKADEFLDDS